MDKKIKKKKSFKGIREFSANYGGETFQQQFNIIIEKTEIGFSVHCPELRGCWSQGKTREEALSNIKDAILTYLDSLDEVLRKKEVCKLVVNR